MSSAKGKSYNNPKRRYFENYAEKGDIYVVSEFDDINLLDGSFYIAQFNGDVMDHPYPAYDEPTDKNSPWQHAWIKLKGIQLSLTNGQPSAEIYGNGRNQIGIVCHIIAGDGKGEDGNDLPAGNGRSVPLSKEVLDYATSFINYHTSEDLPPGWTFSDTANEFGALPNASSMDISRWNDASEQDGYIKYISCDPNEGLRIIQTGVRLKMPGGRVINCWEYANNEGNVLRLSDFTPPVIAALESIQYDVENTKFYSFATEDKLNGQAYSPHGNITWEQKNFFFTIDDIRLPEHRIVKVDAYGGAVAPDCWARVIREGASYNLMLWSFDSKGRKQPFGFSAAEGVWVSSYIEYNGRINAIAITQVQVPISDIGEISNYGVHFIIYDQYGNKGFFSLSRCDDESPMDASGRAFYIVPGKQYSGSYAPAERVRA